MNKSVLVKKQTKTIDKQLNDNNIKRIIVDIRYDDQCGNGYNTFSITGTLYTTKTGISDRGTERAGCIHDEIAKYCPELKHLIKWHLTSANEPLHYIANTVYYAENNDLESARLSAVWLDATLEQLQDETLLKNRLPELMAEFKTTMESLEFIF